MFYLHHTPFWLRMIFPPGLVWEGQRLTGNEVYLTFDDGPHPEATPFVLDQLAAFGMKGSFFCIGKNVVEHPAIYQRILNEGHAVGNHTMHHLNGKHASAADYVANIQQAAAVINSNLFRPPYGQINRKQVAAIQQQFPAMKVVMWSVLSGDFDTKVTGQHCFDAVQKHTRQGSILVFHDSAKAFDRLKVALPLTLQWLRDKGWKSAALEMFP